MRLQNQRSKIKDHKVKVSFLGDTLSKKEHTKIVNDVKELISSGNTFQCEVGFKSKFKIIGDTLSIYEKLRKVNTLRRMIDLMGDDEKTLTLVDRLAKTETNDEFLESLKTA